jgi:hypothetical protein
MKQVILGAEDEYRCKLSKEVQEMARRELQVISKSSIGLTFIRAQNLPNGL